MTNRRSLLAALLTFATLLAPAAAQAETIFERFAPPFPFILPVPVPHVRVETAPARVWHDDGYYYEYRRSAPPPRHSWREERRQERWERRQDRRDRYDRRDRRHDRRWH